MWHPWKIYLHAQNNKGRQVFITLALPTVLYRRELQSPIKDYRHRTIHKGMRIVRMCMAQGRASNWFSFQKGTLWNSVLRLKYATYTEFHHKERLIYDLNAIVASVGGSLGFFLGFSCYHIGKDMIERIRVGTDQQWDANVGQIKVNYINVWRFGCMNRKWNS